MLLFDPSHEIVFTNQIRYGFTREYLDLTLHWLCIMHCFCNYAIF